MSEDKKFDSKTISTMTYSEIVAANREQHKGTFMDKSWRKANGGLELLDDPTLSKWAKFKGGAYTYHNLTTSIGSNFAKRQQKVEFLETLLARKSGYEERDQLLCKKVEIKLMQLFNGYRVPFMAAMATLCFVTLVNPNRTLAMRLGPSMAVIPFVSFYAHHVGTYGVHRGIDKAVAVIESHEDAESEVKREWAEFKTTN